MAIREIKTKKVAPKPEELLAQRMGDLIAFNLSMGESFYKNYKWLPAAEKMKQIWEAAPDGELQLFLCYGGTGGGKSSGAVAFCTDLMLKFPGLAVFGARNTYNEIGDTIYAEFERMWTQYDVPYESRVKPPEFIFPNGSDVKMRSANRSDASGQDKADKMGSMAFGVAVLDEADEISESFFNTIPARLRQPAIPKPALILICNPPYYDHWIYKVFFEKNPGFKQQAPVTCPCGVPGKHNIHPIKFLIDDNLYLPPGYIDNIKRQYATIPTLYNKFVLGNFGPSKVGNPIFEDVFNPTIHVKEGLKPLPNVPLLRGWDFGWRHSACVVAQEDPDTGQVRVLWYLMGRRILLSDFIKEVRFRLGREFAGAQYTDFCDPHGRNRDDRGSKTSIDIMKDAGIYPIAKDTAVAYGLNIMSELMTTMVPRAGMEPALVVNKTCTFLCDALHFGYCQDPRADQSGKPDSLKPLKDGHWDHIVDALRYIIVNIRGDVRTRRYPKKKRSDSWRTADVPSGAYRDGFVSSDRGHSQVPHYGFGRTNRGL